MKIGEGTANPSRMKQPLKTLERKIDALKYSVNQNGLRWTVHFGFFRAVEEAIKGLRGLHHKILARMTKLELERNLPGRNTIRKNYQMWQESTDWNHKGEVWTESEEWKQSVIDEIILKQIEPGKVV